MHRRPRIHIDGVPLHIVQRGYNRGACFSGEQDRSTYLGWLRDALQREHCRLHVYVLTTKHVHLLLTREHATAVPRLIISVGRRYVQYINHTYGRTDTLWGSRYKSPLVQAETYLLLCQRYIERNPVRARMVSDPGDYRWSVCRANGLRQEDAVPSPHPIYLALAADDTSRRGAYSDLFRYELDDVSLADVRMALTQD